MPSVQAGSSTVEIAAKLLADAYRSQKPLSLEGFPAIASIADAVAVQARTMELLGEEIGGFKVSMTPERIATPGIMYASTLHSGRARHVLGAGRAIGFEAEIAVRLAADLPPRPGKPYTRAEVENAVGAALVGIEIVDSRFDRSVKPPLLISLSDRVNNVGFVAGQDVESWRQLDLARLRCVVKRDGAVIHDKVGGHPQNDPLLPLVTYASAQIGSVGGLRRGQIVTLGSLVGLLWFDAPCRLEAEVEGLGAVQFDIAAT
jgi:2-keto-4-pentenoate hydratase